MSTPTAEDILEHFGVRGMKWGVRKDRGDRDKVFRARAKEQQEVKVTTNPGRKVRAEGGKYTPPSDDAIRVARSKQTAKKSTTDALSNKELQDVVTRMNLEKQYTQLLGDQQPISMKLGKAAVKMMLGQVDDDQVSVVGGFVTEKTNSKVGKASEMGVNAARKKAGANVGKAKKDKK